MAQRPRSFTLNDKLTVLERARAEANVRLLKKWGSFIKQRFIDQKDWKYSRQWTIEWLDFALTGVYQLWQNHFGKVKEDKGIIKVVLGKSGITPKYPRGWGWVTGSRGRVGPSWAVRERIERVSWRRPHGCDQRGNCWVVRLQRFWRKSSFVALTWKSKKNKTMAEPLLLIHPWPHPSCQVKRACGSPEQHWLVMDASSVMNQWMFRAVETKELDWKSWKSFLKGPQSWENSHLSCWWFNDVIMTVWLCAACRRWRWMLDEMPWHGPSAMQPFLWMETSQSRKPTGRFVGTRWFAD